MSRLTFNPPGLFLDLRDAAGNQVVPPTLPLRSGFFDFNQWIRFTATPTNVSSSIDVVANSQSNAGASFDYNLDGFSIMTRALGIVLVASALDPTAALANNTVDLSVAGLVLARICVDATTKASSSHPWYAGDGTKGDTRCALSTLSNVTGGAITASTKLYAKTGHGFATGQRVYLVSLTGGTGLTAATSYWFHRLGPDTGYLCATRALALAGTPANVTVDATSVVLTPKADLALDLTAVDANLQIHGLILGTDS